MKSLLEKLQSADEDTKLKWTIVITAVVMVIVIYVWIAYFNTLISGFSQNPVAPPDQAGTDSPGFLQTMKNGLTAIYNMFVAAVRGLAKILNTPREYIVKPPQ